MKSPAHHLNVRVLLLFHITLMCHVISSLSSGATLMPGVGWRMMWRNCFASCTATLPLPDPGAVTDGSGRLLLAVLLDVAPNAELAVATSLRPQAAARVLGMRTGFCEELSRPPELQVPPFMRFVQCITVILGLSLKGVLSLEGSSSPPAYARRTYKAKNAGAATAARVQGLMMEGVPLPSAPVLPRKQLLVHKSWTCADSVWCA